MRHAAEDQLPEDRCVGVGDTAFRSGLDREGPESVVLDEGGALLISQPPASTKSIADFTESGIIREKSKHVLSVYVCSYPCVHHQFARSNFCSSADAHMGRKDADRGYLVRIAIGTQTHNTKTVNINCM